MIDLYKVFMPEDLNMKTLSEVLYSGKLNSGNYVREFEKELKAYIGNPYLFVTANNTYAALIALALLGLNSNDEVIASPMACLASNMPILSFGAKIRWADIDPATGSLDPESVRNKITSRTKAIIHYHWGGFPGYIQEINEIGKETGITIIEDAIESFGSEYSGRKLGNTGSDLTIFSFQNIRLPNSIDGGAIAFNSKENFEKALLLRDFGINRNTFRDSYGEISPESDVKSMGYNAIMNEVSALIGFSVMQKTPDLIDLQRNNARVWDIIADKQKWLPLSKSKIANPNYWIYSFLSENRHDDMLQLRLKGFFSSKVHLRNDYYSCFGGFDDSLKGVKEFEEKQLSVPSGWWVDNIMERYRG